MNRLKTAAALIVATSALTLAPSASAQDKAGDKVNQVIVYGDDPCPQSDDEIVICGRFDEDERYRIPKTLRDNPNEAKNQSWGERAKSFEYVGKSGTQSCSATGAGGFTGCFSQLSSQFRAERQQRPSRQFGKLIEAKRAERLARIDQEAEAVEARLDEIREAREAREKAAAEAKAATAAEVEELPLIEPKKAKPDNN